LLVVLMLSIYLEGLDYRYINQCIDRGPRHVEQ
jgi:hypothetical protein